MSRDFGHLRNLVVGSLVRLGPCHRRLDTRRAGDVSIAYQVVGEGEHDIVLVPGYISNVEFAWEWESWAHLFEGLAGLGRLILFDKRGTGLSDRATGIAQLETRMDDVRAVMDAAGSERAALIGVSEGVAMTLLFAATYPERTTAGRAVRVVAAAGDVGTGLPRCAASRGVAARHSRARGGVRHARRSRAGDLVARSEPRRRR